MDSTKAIWIWWLPRKPPSHFVLSSSHPLGVTRRAKQPRRQLELPWPRGSRPGQPNSALRIKERGAEDKKAGSLLLQRRKKGGGCAEGRASWKSYSGIPRETEAGGCWMERKPQQSYRDSGQRWRRRGPGWWLSESGEGRAPGDLTAQRWQAASRGVPEAGAAAGAHRVLGRTQLLEAVQGQQVGRVLVDELHGLLHSALLPQRRRLPHVCLLAAALGEEPWVKHRWGDRGPAAPSLPAPRQPSASSSSSAARAARLSFYTRAWRHAGQSVRAGGGAGTALLACARLPSVSRSCPPPRQRAAGTVGARRSGASGTDSESQESTAATLPNRSLPL